MQGEAEGGGGGLARGSKAKGEWKAWVLTAAAQADRQKPMQREGGQEHMGVGYRWQAAWSTDVTAPLGAVPANIASSPKAKMAMNHTKPVLVAGGNQKAATMAINPTTALHPVGYKAQSGYMGWGGVRWGGWGGVDVDPECTAYAAKL